MVAVSSPSRVRQRRYEEKNRVREAERKRRWRAENGDHIRAYNRLHRLAQGAAQRQWRAANPDLAKAQGKRHLERRRSPHTGLTRAERDAVLFKQGSCCAVCSSADPGIHWCGDHDHETGFFRGVLCYACNVGLGHFRDDPVRLRTAALYVERHANLHSLF